jgi:hypothetical protein
MKTNEWLVSTELANKSPLCVGKRRSLSNKSSRRLISALWSLLEKGNHKISIEQAEIHFQHTIYLMLFSCIASSRAYVHSLYWDRSMVGIEETRPSEALRLVCNGGNNNTTIN